jgi:hypothetical protein
MQRIGARHDYEAQPQSAGRDQLSASLMRARAEVTPAGCQVISAPVISAPTQCERLINSGQETPGKKYSLPAGEADDLARLLASIRPFCWRSLVVYRRAQGDPPLPLPIPAWTSLWEKPRFALMLSSRDGALSRQI